METEIIHNNKMIAFEDERLDELTDIVLSNIEAELSVNEVNLELAQDNASCQESSNAPTIKLLRLQKN